MADIAGWPHWEIQFDRAGNTAAAARAALLDQIAVAGISDLIFMSHGWNSDIAHACPPISSSGWHCTATSRLRY